MRHRTKTGAALAVLAALLITTVPAEAARTPARRARQASGWLTNHQNDDGSFPGFSALGATADAVIALVAVRRAPSSIEAALDHLETSVAEADTIGEKAKLVLAAVAGGRDPSSFGGEDLVEDLVTSEQPDGHYGAPTPDDPFDGEVTNQALAILALTAAPGVDPSSNALAWLIGAQCADGGWQHTGPQGEDENGHCYTGDPQADFFKSDTNTTSLAVQAIAAHPQATAPLENSPFRFFRKIRDPRKGGWGYTWGLRLTDANSTALAIQAFVSHGKRLPDGAMRALTRLQYKWCGPRAGAFSYTYEERDGRLRKTGPDAGATIGAIPALLKRPLPVDFAEVTRSAPGLPTC